MKTRIVIAIGLVLCMGGCSVKFAYNNVDRFVRWQVNDYADLDREQRKILDAGVEEVWVWHRRSHLPVYADYLEAFAVRSSDEVTPEMLAGLVEQFLTWGLEVQARSMPTAVAVIRSLTDEQVAALPEKLTDSNNDLLDGEQDNTLEESQANWAREVIDQLEQFTGKLQSAQKDYVVRQSTRYQPERVLWVEYRERWQKQLMLELRARAEPEFAQRFTELVNSREDFYSQEYTNVSDANQELGASVAAYVLSNLTDRQAQRFKDRLLQLSKDFRELSTQS
ncbi:MAG: DUF6279 family lipoprotein [Pseudomonadota bacterium]